jgi:hypothetical protein
MRLAELAEVAEMADEKAVAELQSFLSPVQEAQLVIQEAQDIFAAPAAHAPIQLCRAVPAKATAQSTAQVHGEVKLTPKQALHLARHRIWLATAFGSPPQTAQTDAKVYEVVRKLAVALGSSRPEAGTIKALHAVLIQLLWPGTSNMEACTFTNASMSNFARWRRRVAKAEHTNDTQHIQIP